MNARLLGELNHFLGVELGRSDDGEVRAATEGNLVPPGVSGGALPNCCSNGFGSRLNDPPASGWPSTRSSGSSRRT